MQVRHSDFMIVTSILFFTIRFASSSRRSLWALPLLIYLSQSYKYKFVGWKIRNVGGFRYYRDGTFTNIVNIVANWQTPQDLVFPTSESLFSVYRVVTPAGPKPREEVGDEDRLNWFEQASFGLYPPTVPTAEAAINLIIGYCMS